ncbi:type IV pilus modification PilV family protein [Bythopirellula goksoeyrii]|uniref:Uncharacterized protein n=1 Tax=Bythopirellula goksoeyrii TaxID=1400387 RepID=A0A5B9Q9Q9_9BACT|nr:hypothetical protein [Bythopirellula goksoeyrii]QEG34489.1 hypothetical protein Pr1d_17690 [Bythopirellula goksoeyrii]
MKWLVASGWWLENCGPGTGDWGLGMRTRHSTLTTHHSPLTTRSGITLIEILISMFVLLFGLMGVAAIFPVASHYLVQGDQKDRSDQLANNAFAEIEARGFMDPHSWYYADHMDATPNNLLDNYPVGTKVTASPTGLFTLGSDAGHAFAIDPLGSAEVDPNDPNPSSYRAYFPYGALDGLPWPNVPLYFPPVPPGTLSTLWPVRRVTFERTTGYVLDTNKAETTFRLRDDLAVELPDQGDRPAMQRWSVDNTTGNLLARQYQGDYSWLATVVPVDNNALLGLQPAANLDGGLYDVSVVVFYKRDIVPSASASGSPGSERLIAAEFLNQGELLIYDANSNDPDVVDAAVDGLRATNWICVMGVNQINGQFMMKWYRILAMDEDSEDMQYSPAGITGNAIGRTLMVSEGGAWPSDSWQNLQVAILPGAIHVQTRQMPLSCECCQ